MKSQSNFQKNYLISFAEILSRLPLILTVGFLAKSIGVEAFGAWALVLIIQTLAITIGSAGMSSALIRFVPNANLNLAYDYFILSFKKSALILILFAIFISFSYNQIGVLLNIDKEYRWLILMSMLMAAGSILDGHIDAYFKGKKIVKKQIYFLISKTLAEVFSVVLVFYFLNFSHPSISISIYIIFVLGVKLLIYPWLIIESLSLSRRKIETSLKKEFLNFSYLLLPGIILGWAIIQLDRVIISQMLNSEEIGIYAFSATLASYFVFLSYSIMPLFQSMASSYYDQNELKKLSNLFEIWQFIFLAVGSIALMIVAFFSEDILIFTAGYEFSKYPKIFIILCVSICVDQFLGQYHYIFYLIKKPKFTTYFFATKLLTLSILIPTFIFLFGIYGAAFGVLVSVFTVNLIQYIFAIKLINLKISLFIWSYSILLATTIILFYYLTSMNYLNRSMTLFILTPLIVIYSYFKLKKLGYYHE
jgi:O-antigen/teichoic acid export membrane protein